MKIIVVHGKHNLSRSLTLSPVGRFLFGFCLLGIPALLGGVTGYYLAAGDGSLISRDAANSWRHSLAEQQKLLDETRKQADQQLLGLSVKVAEMQARLVRLDAVGERLTRNKSFAKGEFDFSQPPAMGGPEIGALPLNTQGIDFVRSINELSARIDDRWAQLDTLEGMLTRGESSERSFVTGLPVNGGWQSSAYGYRTDPFTGRMAWHSGVDFAGQEGTEIMAVAAGVVTWASEREGYGLLVEINHGDGYLTRYAHNQKSKVKVGDVVQKGQVVSLMGNSGRSTGAHVHYEVYKNGRAVDPAAYLHRTYR
jgi:murein DD-endopeptidase MepM/ murein hydrolase activator NlpD